MKKLAIFLVAILAGSVTIPNVFSDDESQSNSKENNNIGNVQENNNDTKENGNQGIHFGFSNATSVNVTLPNGTTMTFGFSNGTNIGQQISSFIHPIRNGFKQQEAESKQAIKDCREQARQNPADRKNIMSQCKATLQEINQQFKGEHKQFQMDFKQLRNLIPDSKQGHENLYAQKDAKIQNNTLEKLLPGQSLNHGKQNQNHGKQNQNHGKQNHGRQD
ncbi:MAG: hypothetical protein KGI09_07545 [Thaumarchaeota archaeon]|nr:hypothetical protein [Nitrososphaerota archaeon]